MPKDERKRVSQQQEKHAAHRHGARLHPGSGSGARRNDMSTKKSLIECKTVLVGNRQITLKATDLEQLRKEAALQDRAPVMLIEIAGKRWILQLEEDAAPL